MPASTVELDTADGPMPVFQAGQAATRGIVVIQDVFGVGGYLEGVAEELGDAGWLALAPHLYHRDGSPVVGYDQFPVGAAHMKALTGARILCDLDACLVHLATKGIPADRTAVIGFCMGGTVAFFAATERPIGAAVTFYGQAAAPTWEGVPPAVDQVRELQAPWLGLFGADDPLVPLADVERLDAATAAAPVPTKIVVYPGAGHAFHRASTPDTFQPQAAAASWRQCTEWLDAYLPDPPTLALSQSELTQP